MNVNKDSNIYPSGSAPACIFGTPKMYIVAQITGAPSSSDSFSYFFIITLLAIFVISFCPQFLVNTLVRILFRSFLRLKIANLTGKFLISYDVTSLFINISLEETIGIGFQNLKNPFLLHQ